MKPKPLTPKALEALRHIRNRVVHGQEPPSVRELQALLGYASPNSAAYVIDQLIRRHYLTRREDGKLQVLKGLDDEASNAKTVRVPLVGSAPCGAPFLAEQRIDAWMPISIQLARPPHRYFLLRAVGDSMNRTGISDGDRVLVRQQATAEEGDRVVALVDDEATIKEFHRAGEAIALVPRSTNDSHQPIILTTDFQIQGVVCEVFKNWEKGNQ